MIIYQITNKVNGKTYIGKTGRTLEERFYFHYKEAEYGSETHLHRAIRKYGVGNYTTKIIESQVPPEDIDDRERHYIKTLKPEYNMTEGGEGGNTSSSPNFIKAMKEYHSRKPKEEYATYGMKGKSQTENQKSVTSKKNSYPVCIEGITYPSIKEARSILHVTERVVRYRIDSPNYPDWYRVRPKRVTHIHPS